MKLRLKELRNARGITLAELAEEIGVTKATISRWESGERSISMIYADKLAKKFNTSIDYLLGISTRKVINHGNDFDNNANYITTEIKQMNFDAFSESQKEQLQNNLFLLSKMIFELASENTKDRLSDLETELEFKIDDIT